MNPGYLSGDQIVDQVIGSAYQVVSYVASNMDMLTQLSNAMPTLTQYMESINALLDALPIITNVNDHLTELIALNTNLAALLNINSNMAALLNINTNLAEILAVPEALAAQDWKNSVVVASTANLDLNGTETIDGIAVVAGQRVLVKNQTTGSQNGIYVVAAGAWARAADAVAPNVNTNNMVTVERGVIGAGKMFRLATVGNIIVGTTTQTWSEFTSSPTIVGEDAADAPVTVTAASKVTYNGEHFTLTVTGSEVAVALSQAILDSIGSGGGGASVGTVIGSILTDGTNILMDSDGNVLYEETIN